MIRQREISDQDVRRGIKALHIQFGGNSQLQIYGTLGCQSGKRMQRKNRVFFASAQAAIEAGYRPCGNCMKEAYKKWTGSRIL